ncbi:uvrB/UvrC domain protein (DUF3506) [Tasmannia lanceolata]|uniref:uvrB/UvrC domain protein (DUF3506) n=1 Tax=Tasmannia lanceolata TaxID=3420 RepID=UPI004062E9D1
MASISAPPNPPKLLSKNPRFPPLKKKSYISFPTSRPSSRPPDSTTCRCQNRSDSTSPYDDFIHPKWDSMIQGVVNNAVQRWNDYVNSYRSPLKKNLARVEEKEEKREERGDWDWDRWRRHFEEVEDQERIVSVLKSQLGVAVHREDYEDAAKLKVAVAAAARNDTVGRAIYHLNRAVEEERYKDAAFIRDHAGAGLVGWWAGISEDSTDPYGRLIHISAEHGRYVARSYNSRQLATASPGVPLFEIFFTLNGEGEYKQQAVYLKRNRGNSGDFLTKSSKPLGVTSLNPITDSTEGNNDFSAINADNIEEGEERDDDSDVAEGLSGIQSILRDMIPGAKVKVVEVIAPDRDLIFKALEQDSDEEDEERDEELESVESEDEVKAESDRDVIEMDDGGVVGDTSEEQSQMAVKVVIGGLVKKFSSDMPPKNLLRVPARLEKRGRLSFSFSIKNDVNRQETGRKGPGSLDKTATLPGQRSMEHVMSDLAKVLISRKKIPRKVLKEVGDLINLTLSQAQNRQPLSGSTIFSRIQLPATSDPLNGLYIGAHGLYTSEIIHLRHKFGQWQEDGGAQNPPNLEFYEYVEALKLTGDPYVPAGQVAFRAKVGKQNQLPHKGIIPEEFGVVARYRGQGRLAEPGFQNPRWVDGELVILDGKYIKGGPVVGFVYWAPEYHFLVFFNRLRLQD